MPEPNMIVGIVGSSIGILVTLIGLLGRSAAVPRSRQHIEEVQEQKRVLRHKHRKAKVEIRSLDEINAQGVRYLRRETKNLIQHSHGQIEKFERFYNVFKASRTVRTWNYIGISMSINKISKYAKRFETYSDWITIARLSISLTLISDQISLGGASVCSSGWRDVHRLRDELHRAKQAKDAHPERLKNLQVKKGVNLERLERYANGLVLMFDASDTGTTNSTLILDDLLGVHAAYHPESGTREQYYGQGRAAQVHSPIDRSSWATFMHDDQVYDIPRTPQNVHTSQLDSDRILVGTKMIGDLNIAGAGEREHEGDDEWNTAPVSQRGRLPRERYRHSISNDRADTMTSGLGHSESEESEESSRRSRPPIPLATPTRGGIATRRSGAVTRIGAVFGILSRTQVHLMRYRSQSRSSHSSRHTDARQEQQHHENVANIEIRPSTRHHRSGSSSASVSSIPSHDSGYGSLNNSRYSSGASVVSTRRRSSSRPHQRQRPEFSGGDRSKPPIALDRMEDRIRKVEARTRRTTRGDRALDRAIERMPYYFYTEQPVKTGLVSCTLFCTIDLTTYVIKSRLVLQRLWSLGPDGHDNVIVTGVYREAMDNFLNRMSEQSRGKLIAGARELVALAEAPVESLLWNIWALLFQAAVQENGRPKTNDELAAVAEASPSLVSVSTRPVSTNMLDERVALVFADAGLLMKHQILKPGKRLRWIIPACGSAFVRLTEHPEVFWTLYGYVHGLRIHCSSSVDIYPVQQHLIQDLKANGDASAFAGLSGGSPGLQVVADERMLRGSVYPSTCSWQRRYLHKNAPDRNGTGSLRVAT
ncbi:hypothetical protein CIB48_g3714 [Xylaria polymorpha]|nr:hypothetical protein CIB48_g3714 [Xylaria polymorpha]